MDKMFELVSMHSLAAAAALQALMRTLGTSSFSALAKIPSSGSTSAFLFPPLHDWIVFIAVIRFRYEFLPKASIIMGTRLEPAHCGPMSSTKLIITVAVVTRTVVHYKEIAEVIATRMREWVWVSDM